MQVNLAKRVRSIRKENVIQLGKATEILKVEIHFYSNKASFEIFCVRKRVVAMATVPRRSVPVVVVKVGVLVRSGSPWLIALLSLVTKLLLLLLLRSVRLLRRLWLVLMDNTAGGVMVVNLLTSLVVLVGVLIETVLIPIKARRILLLP